MNGSSSERKVMRYVRYYVLITAVIIIVQVGIFLWFMERENIKGIIGASVSTNESEWATGVVLKDSTKDSAVKTTPPGEKANGSKTSEIFGTIDTITSPTGTLTEPLIKMQSGTALEVSFGALPSFDGLAKMDELTVRFPSTKAVIQVNKQTLELSSLNRVNLKIDGFSGNLKLNSGMVSGEGIAHRISVNGVVLSGKELEISFSDIQYELIQSEGIEITTLELSNGTGELKLAQEKLVYRLELKDQITLSSVTGKLILDKNSAMPVVVKGMVKYVEVRGIVDLKLR